MVSANLYELDDLGATLLESLRTANHTLTIQVVKELRVSGEEAYCRSLLTLAWILSPIDCDCDSTFAHVFHNLEDLLFVLLRSEPYNYPDIPEPLTIPPPKPSKSPPPSAWSALPQAYTPEQAHTLYRAIKYALKTKFWEHAAYLLTSLLSEHSNVPISLLKALEFSPIFTQLIESTVYAPLLPRIIEHACAAYVGSPGPIKKDKKFVMILNTPSKGRLFQIMPESYAMWNVKPKPETRLQGAPTLITEDNASSYWKNAVEKYKITAAETRLEFADESIMEEFYNTYFPHDIPDEWSTHERAKSHGVHVPTIPEKNPWQAAFHLLDR